MKLFLKCRVLFGLIVVLVVANGCGPKRMLTRPDLTVRTEPGTRVLLMPPDIELYELTAGGLGEPKAAWTVPAKQYVEEALRAELGAKNTNLQVYQRPENPSKEYAHQQLIKLHDAVGGSIFLHQILRQPNMSLPTKKGKFDWSLGEGVNTLREEFNADYAMFMFLRESYKTAGRVAVTVVTGILTLGHVVPGQGQRGGFASIVDLRTGNILWFNHVFGFPGDLREAKGAQSAVKYLLTGFPL